MNITHTTFPSVPSPLVREEPTIILPPVKIGLPVVVSTADDSSSPTVAAAVVVAGNNQFSFPPPPVVMAAPASAAPQTPIQQQQKIQQVQQPKKVEVSVCTVAKAKKEAWYRLQTCRTVLVSIYGVKLCTILVLRIFDFCYKKQRRTEIEAGRYCATLPHGFFHSFCSFFLR